MTVPHEQDAPQKQAPPLTVSELLHHYFAIENELYEAKARGDISEMTSLMQNLVDSLRADLIEAVDKVGGGKTLRQALYEEQRVEKLALWLRKTANKLKATKPGLLSLELLGSAGVVVAITYYVIRVDAWVALFIGFLIVIVRLSLPWVVNRIAQFEERGLRKLRKIDQH
jgi:hypothetical protein